MAVLLDAHIQVRSGWLSPLLATLDDPLVAGVQPLVLQRDDTIDSAGFWTAGEATVPVPLLRGHPKEDARRLRGQPLSALSPDAMVLRADDALAVGGLQESGSQAQAALDLCARLLQKRPGGFRVADRSLVTSSRSTASHAAPNPPARVELLSDPGRSRDPESRLRWSLKLPSPAGARGDTWGDTHFAEALAGALRDLGQDVVTRRREAHAAGPTHLDDVALAIRGLFPIPASPGQTNVLWVISHPDDVDPQDFDGYDLVLAASPSWATEVAARTGRDVLTLLQATSFEPPGARSEVSMAPEVVFVGGAHSGRERPLVWKAVEAGVPLAVYGPGWDDLPPGVWRGEHVENRQLPELYQRHGIVLADHWPDMARQGFIANRVFDAVASGARVICDDVAGVHEVFDPRDVVVVHTPEDIKGAVERLGRTARTQGVPRTSLTFEDRARTLLQHVRRLRQS